MRARDAAVLALLAALLISGCGSGSKPTPAVERTPVVVDTDMGPDDALALLYLVSRRDVDVRAVAVSGTGLVRCPAGAEQALKLLAAAGREDIPVACGRDAPLAGFNAFPYRGPTVADGAGEGAFDTVNRSSIEMTHMLGRLSDGRDVVDLRRFVRRDRPFEPPLWFSRVATGTTPPASTMTWLVTAEPGDYAIVVEGPGGTQVLAGIRAR